MTHKSLLYKSEIKEIINKNKKNDKFISMHAFKHQDYDPICFMAKMKSSTACKGKALIRFSGGDEAVLCSYHWTEAKKALRKINY